ncbi:hypothetical protein BCR32DRAFT_290507 [Anaeromyces robustus]|uniref:Uncharacterized protein n=1 Tax=Anaeromyces robustus TaxID=1754192 RepID=A0A1Y1XJ42_9FUNG|nr:hypothetical protein BCR32DRAFT_290507 [Anaeromyces robustus]|eukprot:ORX85723.1 hypothetical protein BCR32DRAFT_290507 [Anaeromyces robustus]
MTLSSEQLSIYLEGIQKQIDELNKVIKNGNEKKEVLNSNETNSEEMNKLIEEKEYYKKQYEKSEYRILFLLRKINELEAQMNK